MIVQLLKGQELPNQLKEEVQVEHIVLDTVIVTIY